MNRLKIFRFSLYSAIVSIYILAIIPLEIAQIATPLWDKTNHFIAFFVLSILIKLSYNIKSVKIFIYLLGYGVFIELSQLLLTTTRFGEINDVIADIIGTTIGLIVIYLFRFIKYNVIDDKRNNNDTTKQKG